MRFSTVVAASTAALAGSAVALPVTGYEHDITARSNEEVVLHLRAFFDTYSPRTPESADSRPKLQRAKKLNPAEVEAALKQLKGKRSSYLEDLDSMDARELFADDFELATRDPATHVPNNPPSSSTSNTKSNYVGARPNASAPGTLHRSPTNKIKSSTGRAATNGRKRKPLSTTQKAQQDFATAGTDYQKAQAEFKKAEADLEAARKMRTEGLNQLGIGSLDKGLSASAPASQKSTGASKFRSKKRSLDNEDLIGTLAARETNYQRSLDVEDFLTALSARGFADEDHDVFGRTSSAPVTPSKDASTTSGPGAAPALPGQPNSKRPSSGANHRPSTVKPRVSLAGAKLRKPTAAERGQKSLSTASTDFNRAQAEFQQAKKDLEAARNMRTKAMGELGLGGIDDSLGASTARVASGQKSNSGTRNAGPAKRSLYVERRGLHLEEVMEIVARVHGHLLD